MVPQLVARTVRVTPSKQKQHNESAVQTSSKPFIPRNPALRSQHLKSVFPGGFNLAKFRTHPSRQLAEVAPEPVESTTTEYEEYKGPDPSEYQVDPATLDWLRPVDVDYTPGSFEECEVTVQVVRPTEHVLQLPQPAFEPEANFYRFRVSCVPANRKGRCTFDCTSHACVIAAAECCVRSGRQAGERSPSFGTHTAIPNPQQHSAASPERARKRQHPCTARGRRRGRVS